MRHYSTNSLYGICGHAHVHPHTMTIVEKDVTCEQCLVLLVEEELKTDPNRKYAHEDMRRAARALGKATRDSLNKAISDAFFRKP